MIWAQLPSRAVNVAPTPADRQSLAPPPGCISRLWIDRPVGNLRHRQAVADLRLGGGTDYVVKPFSPAELVARIDAVLRRVNVPVDEQPAVAIGELLIEPASRRVLVQGSDAQLTGREFDLLLFFAQHPGQVFSRNQLMDAVWQYSFYTDTSTVTVHIRRLRAKIEADPAKPRHLQTVWGVGYRFQP